MHVEMGTPFARKRRATATLPHSQTGMSIPMQSAGMSERIGFFGTSRSNVSSLTNTWTTAETATPNKRNGVASTRMPRKIEIQSCNSGAMENLGDTRVSAHETFSPSIRGWRLGEAPKVLTE